MLPCPNALKGAHSLPLLVQGLLTTWSNTSDPCDNAWAFVSCNCTDTYPALSPSDCTAAEGDPNSRRVLVLAISGVTRTRGRQLHGPISAAIANLTELRIVDLHDNALSVSPARIRRISEPETRHSTQRHCRMQKPKPIHMLSMHPEHESHSNSV